MLMVIIMLAVVLLVSGCAPTHSSSLRIPSSSAFAPSTPLFNSLDPHPEAAIVMTAALKAQLKADGVFQVVEDPRFAEAFFKGTVGKWTGVGWTGRGPVIRGQWEPAASAPPTSPCGPPRRSNEIHGAWWPTGSSPVPLVSWLRIGRGPCYNSCPAMPSKSSRIS